MSVAIIVSFNSPERDDLYLPVASEGPFVRWLSEAKRQGLELIPRFEPGATLTPAELPAVIAEIEAIRRGFAQNKRTIPMLERVDFLLRSLSALDPSEIKEISCG